ncbi:MAG: MBL fold metallo-hydrolase [Gammaproteobacteria bacterium]|nr:MBL fold metallo-hydrolase [Gammaproteobacteria bacterium]
MKIRHFLYNAFLVEDIGIKIAIDPGQNLWLFKLRSLTPTEEWKTITHVLVTHGDPDHYWHADRVATAANAPLIMNTTMVKRAGSETRILVPRRDALQFVPFSGNVTTIQVGETIEIKGVKIQGVKTKHGPIEFSILGIKKRKIPGPEERAGFGAIGFFIQVNGKTILNLGDSLYQKEWARLQPDVLMMPIGGLGKNTWTMDVTEALEAVRLIRPKVVIPCHYNVPFLWKQKMCPADDQEFKREVEKMQIACHIMHDGEAIEV